MLARMPAILRALLALLLAAALWPAGVQARSAKARIDRVDSAVGTLHGVRLDLHWPEGAAAGALRLRASRVEAPALGHRFTHVDWQCPLRRADRSRWRCEGPVRTPRGNARLQVDIREDGLDAVLEQGARRIDVRRRGDAPDLTRVDLTRIPLAWLDALLARAWPEAQLKGGEGDARLRVTTPRDGLRIAGPLALRGVSFDTPDGTAAAEGVDADLDMDLLLGDTDRVRLAGRIGRGEALFGTAYLALQERTAAIVLEAQQSGACCWRIPRFEWGDGDVLRATGALAFGADGGFRDVEVQVASDDAAGLRDAYLSGWLGTAGLADLELSGRMRGRVAVTDGRLRAAEAELAGLHARDPGGRFAFEGLDGAVRYSGSAPVAGELRWLGGRLYGLDFGATRIATRSEAGTLRLAAPVQVPMLGVRLRFEDFSIRPAGTGQPAEVAFGMDVENLDVAELSRALGWPAFSGTLSGRIPAARYRNDSLVFEGGLSMQLFGGRVDVSALAMDRPFGVAPTLGADIAMDDLDLEALTGVLGFGTITGRLDGRIAGLRLVDWQPVAFDARLRSDRHRGVRQRISQRAVQDLSSVGDASFVTSLQSRLIGFFDDFGYSALGIDCRLADGVCDMGGLEPVGDDAFLIVRGAGIPRLTVVGINRRVDWPTLVERLVAVGSGESRPVVD